MSVCNICGDFLDVSNYAGEGLCNQCHYDDEVDREAGLHDDDGLTVIEDLEMDDSMEDMADEELLYSLLKEVRGV
jgi:hypothetical protein